MDKIVVDVYGADAGALPVIKGTLSALRKFPELSAVLVGRQEELACLSCFEFDNSRVETLLAEDVVTNHDQPSEVFSGRGDSTLVKALLRLKTDEDCIGLISAGNTGALLVGSIFRLGLVKGIKMPALASLIPIADGRNILIADCGANLDCSAKQLSELAVMGSAFYSCAEGVDAPRVGLLSVGRENEKGNAVTKEAFGLLSALPINFVGNIEGNDPVEGAVDVVVTDGFAGNILLKNVEASGKAAIAAVEAALSSCPDCAVASLQAVRDRLKNAFDFNPRGGATFLGTVKPVVKMHGSLTEDTPCACIDQIIRLRKAGFIDKISAALSK